MQKAKHSSVFLCLICRLLWQTFLNCSHLLFFLYSRVLPHLHRGGFYSPFCHTLSSFLPVHCSELRGLYCSRDTLLYQLWVLFALISLLHLSKSCLLYKSMCVAHVCSLLSLLNTSLYYCALIHVKFFVFTERINITYPFSFGNYFINHFICWFILSSVNHRNISSNKKEFLLNAVLLMLGLTIFSVCALFPCPVLYSFPGKCHRITYFP